MTAVHVTYIYLPVFNAEGT